jgi:serine/threonine protein kinase
MAKPEDYYKGLSRHVDFASLPDPTLRFELHEVIGEGTYGEVYAALDRNSGKLLE